MKPVTQTAMLMAVLCALGLVSGVTVAVWQRSTMARDSNSSSPLSAPRPDTVIAALNAAAAPSLSASSTPSRAELAMTSASTAYSQAWELSRVISPAGLAGPPKVSIWRIVGQTQVGSEARALVLFEGSSVPEMKRPGDTLPGGAKIVAIDGNSIEVQVGAQRMFVVIGQP